MEPIPVNEAKVLKAAITLEEFAANDTDRASCFVLGDSWKEARGAIFVIKGRLEAQVVRSYIKESCGWMTDGKGIAKDSPETIGGEAA